MSILSIVSQVTAFDDASSGNQPTKRLMDWRRSLLQLPVTDPKSEKITLDPLASLVVFDGTRSTSIDGTSAFALTTSSLSATRYRITNSAGTAPALRTARSVTLSGLNVTITVNLNLSVTITVSAGTPFGAVQVGDVVFLPGVSTGDPASPFNNLNLGYWTVLTASSASITVARADGTVFEGLTETVAVVSNTSLQAYSIAGVQVGDTVALSAGFATPALRSFSVQAINPSWFEFVSTTPLGAQTGIIPGVSGVAFYTNAKRFVYVESDQEVSVRCNGDVGNFNVLTPWVSGDEEKVGMFQRAGTSFKLELVNKSSTKARIFVASAE